MIEGMTERSTAQQLTLLPAPDVPLQFRLDEATRRRGLRHIAEIRLQLAARQAARSATTSEIRRRTAA
jgi:hypothetical protein